MNEEFFTLKHALDALDKGFVVEYENEIFSDKRKLIRIIFNECYDNVDNVFTGNPFKIIPKEETIKLYPATYKFIDECRITQPKFRNALEAEEYFMGHVQISEVEIVERFAINKTIKIYYNETMLGNEEK